MTTERFSTQASTTLAASIEAGDLSISVQSTTHFPVLPEFRIRVGQELMLVTGVSGATWTVTRGIEGTTAAGHIVGTAVVAVLTAGALDEMRAEIEAETNIIWVGPPVDGSSTDDWAAVNTAVQAAPEGSVVKLRRSSLSYICNHTSVAARSNITLDLNGNVITTTSTFGLGTCPIVANPGIPATIGSIGATSAGVNSLTVTWSGTPLVAGDYFWINTSKGGRVSFQAVSVVGTTVNLDAPVLFSIPSGTICKYAPVINFNLKLNGAKVLCVFDGTYADNRWIELISAWKCSVVGPGIIQQTGGTSSTSLVGFDIGGRDNKAEDYTTIGLDGTDSNRSGTAFEGQRGAFIRNLKSNNIGFTLWINTLWDSTIDGVTGENCCGALTATSINIDTPANECGCHRNTIRGLKANIVGGLGVIWTGSDFCDNDISDLNGSAQTPELVSGIIILGANGTLGCNRNHFGKVLMSGTTAGIIYGNACISKDNVVDAILVDKVSKLLTLEMPGQSLTVHDVRGQLVVPEAIKTVGSGARVIFGAVDLVTPPNAAGAQIRYANKGSVTLNGTTPVFLPAPWTTPDSTVSLARTAPGGSAHGVPIYSLVASTMAVTGNGLFLIDAGVASWDDTTLVEDTSTGGHDISTVVGTIPGYVRGPVVFRVRIKPNGRNWVALAVGGGSGFANFNLITGALGTVVGGASGYAIVNADGSVDCVMIAPDMATNVATIWMAEADNTLSYTGNGSSFVISNLSLTGLNAVAVSAESGNNDVYSVSVN